MKRIIIVLALLLFMGCSATSNLCTVPEANNSVVCDLSAKLHITPEMISQSLLIANFGALEVDLYTAQQADKFVNNLIGQIEKFKASGNTYTYAQAISFINSQYNLLPKKIQAVFVIIDPAGLASQNITLPLTNYDFDLFLRHLNKQKQIISIYL